MHSTIRWPSLSLNAKLLDLLFCFASRCFLLILESSLDFWDDTKNQGRLAVITHTATRCANSSLFSIQLYPMNKTVPTRLYHGQRYFYKKQSVQREADIFAYFGHYQQMTKSVYKKDTSKQKSEQEHVDCPASCVCKFGYREAWLLEKGIRLELTLLYSTQAPKSL